MEGSLGGLQVVDLTPEGHMHQKIVSVGRDPVIESLRPLYIVSQSMQDEERKAFSFRVSRSLDCSQGNGNYKNCNFAQTLKHIFNRCS